MRTPLSLTEGVETRQKQRSDAEDNVPEETRSCLLKGLLGNAALEEQSRNTVFSQGPPPSHEVSSNPGNGRGKGPPKGLSGSRKNQSQYHSLQ
ncbi:hypothetical protein E2C01_070844 [Portunus trituberculatus]|uniref:Uncharacterized protein n=1 Tax=Portunus trituberculatus TaxID=210409 RepID=A0A5B7I6J2_PORTR|nr:hypothetical protein [Portunus trituberculatus]